MKPASEIMLNWELEQAKKMAEDLGRMAGELEQANKHIIQVDAKDSFSMQYYVLKVHEGGTAGQIKATLNLQSHFQLESLLRTLLEFCDIDPGKDDLHSLDLAWVWE